MRGIVLDKFEIKEQGGIGHIYITKEVAEITKECWNELLGVLQHGVVIRFEAGFNRDCLKDTFIYSEGNETNFIRRGSCHSIASLFECDYMGDYEGVYSRWLTDMKRGLADLMEFEGEDDYLWAKSQSQLCVRVRKVEKGSEYRVLSDEGMEEEVIESNLLVKMLILTQLLLFWVVRLDRLAKDRELMVDYRTITHFLQNDKCMYELVSDIFEKVSVRLRDTVNLKRIDEWKNEWWLCSDIMFYVPHAYIAMVFERIQEVPGVVLREKYKQCVNFMRESLEKAFDSNCELKPEYKEDDCKKYREEVIGKRFDSSKGWFEYNISWSGFIISAWENYRERIEVSARWSKCRFNQLDITYGYISIFE